MPTKQKTETAIDQDNPAPVTSEDPRQWEFLQTIGTQGLRTLAGALGIDAPNTRSNPDLAREIAQTLGGDEPALRHRPRTGDDKPNT